MCKIKDTIESELDFINKELDYLYTNSRKGIDKVELLDICNSCGVLCEELYCNQCQYEIENSGGYWH
jgi:hypothetical protein